MSTTITLQEPETAYLPSIRAVAAPGALSSMYVGGRPTYIGASRERLSTDSDEKWSVKSDDQHSIDDEERKSMDINEVEPVQIDIIRPLETDKEKAVGILGKSSPSTTGDLPTGFAFYLIIFSLALAYMLSGFDNTVVATAVPAITDHFHTVTQIGWYSTAYRLSLCAFQFIFSKLYGMCSPKRTFLASILIMMIGSLLCATAVSSMMFVIGRAVAGMGAAGITAGCFNIVVQISPLQKRPQIIAVLSAMESFSEMTAPILGGILTQHLSWRWCFYIGLPLGAVTCAVTLMFLRDPPPTDELRLPLRQKLERLDVIGNLLFLPSVTCLFVALSYAGTRYSWKSPFVVGLLVAFVVLLAMFAYQESRKGDGAILPPRIMKQRTVLYAILFAMCCSGSLQVFQYYLPTYYQSVRQYSPSKSGYLMLPSIVGFAVGLLLQGFGTSTIGSYAPFMLLFAVIAPAAAGCTTTWQLSTSLAELLGISLLCGFAYGIGYQGPQVAVQTVLAPGDASTGLAIILFAQHFGAALFVMLGETIFTNRLQVNLQSVAQGLSTATIENMGLEQLETVLGPARRQAVLVGVDHSLVQMWYLPVVLTCISMVGALGVEWRSVKRKQN